MAAIYPASTWQALMDSSPTTPRAKPKADRRTKEEQVELNQRMWAAVDQGDCLALEEALVDGAAVMKYRNGYPALWMAVQASRYDVAKILIGHGAQVKAAGKAGQNVWTAIASRNNPEEAEQLKALVGTSSFASPNDFLSNRSYRLLLWWLRDDPANKAPKPSQFRSAGPNNQMWVMAALHGPQELLPLINQQWGVNEKDPISLTKIWDVSMARVVWEEIARRDNVALGKRALAHGWGPPPPGSYGLEDKRSSDVTPLWGQPLGWYFISKKAWNLLDWWMSIPHLAEQMRTSAKGHPQDTAWHLVLDFPTFERVMALGVDLDAKDAKGNLLAHYLFDGAQLSQLIIDWWIVHRPMDLECKNQDGHTPITLPKGKKTKEAMQAKARERFLLHRLNLHQTQPVETFERKRF